MATKTLKRKRKEADSKEFWKYKRAKFKNTQKKKKQKLTKEEYLNSDLYIQNNRKKIVKKKWKDINKEDIAWNTPHVVIDLQFSNILTEKENKSVVMQLQHLYGKLKAAERPLKLHLCSVVSPIKELLDKVSYQNWKV